MITKKDEIDDLIDDRGPDIVTWGPKYATGIKLMDRQHEELVFLTNQLYHACLSGNEIAEKKFKDAMKRMVDYVHFHFGTEQQLLQKIGYPHYIEHKKMHDDLIRSILEAAKEFNEGRKFVPNHFVRTLKDWIFGHIGIEDKNYAEYVAEQKKKGRLTEEEINKIVTIAEPPADSAPAKTTSKQ
ncbi:MAG TPA: hemerythrin [Treponema sp.]|nr:hemerythrin [Treponema sp.]